MNPTRKSGAIWRFVTHLHPNVREFHLFRDTVDDLGLWGSATSWCPINSPIRWNFDQWRLLILMAAIILFWMGQEKIHPSIQLVEKELCNQGLHSHTIDGRNNKSHLWDFAPFLWLQLIQETTSLLFFYYGWPLVFATWCQRLLSSSCVTSVAISFFSFIRSSCKDWQNRKSPGPLHQRDVRYY